MSDLRLAIEDILDTHFQGASDKEDALDDIMQAVHEAYIVVVNEAVSEERKACFEIAWPYLPTKASEEISNRWEGND
jgi:hypothetical protein